MAKNSVYVGVVILAVIAVVLGYKIYQQQTALKGQPGQSNQPVQNTQQSVLKTTPTTTVKQPATSTSSNQNTNISADRQKISAYPGPSAPDEQKKEFGRIIGDNAQTSDTLDITNCETTPMVLSVKNGQSIKLINNDATVNAILFGPGKQYDVPANGSTTMLVNLGAGINTYRCTGISGSPIVGVFVVTQ